MVRIFYSEQALGDPRGDSRSPVWRSSSPTVSEMLAFCLAFFFYKAREQDRYANQEIGVPICQSGDWRSDMPIRRLAFRCANQEIGVPICQSGDWRSDVPIRRLAFRCANQEIGVPIGIDPLFIRDRGSRDNL